MAYLRIRNLGPIRQLELEVKQFNILIGEQATGKSIICKSIFFFREMKRILAEYFYSITRDGMGRKKFPKALNATITDTFIQLFGYSWELPEDLSMLYQYCAGVSMQVCLERSGEQKYISLRYSEPLKDAIRRLEQTANEKYRASNKMIYEKVTTFFQSENIRWYWGLEEEVNRLLDDDMETYYIPAGRSLMTLLTNQKTRFDYDLIDPVNRRFMQFIESIQPRFSGGVSHVHLLYPNERRKYDVQKIAKRIIQGMKGEYIYSKGQEYLRLPGRGEGIPINYASSGQQEALWLLNQLYVLMLKNERAFVIIEEPEAHVYPTLQREILEFIVQFMNFTGSTVFVTTHSPYILTCANGLYYGGSLIKKNAKLQKKVESILGEETYIEPDKFMGLKLINSDQVTITQSLVDDDFGQITPELIDEVSDKINEQYTDLFYLEEENGDDDTEARPELF